MTLMRLSLFLVALVQARGILSPKNRVVHNTPCIHHDDDDSRARALWAALFRTRSCSHPLFFSFSHGGDDVGRLAHSLALAQGVLAVCFYSELVPALFGWRALNGVDPSLLLLALLAGVAPVLLELALAENAVQARRRRRLSPSPSPAPSVTITRHPSSSPSSSLAGCCLLSVGCHRRYRVVVCCARGVACARPSAVSRVTTTRAVTAQPVTRPRAVSVLCLSACLSVCRSVGLCGRRAQLYTIVSSVEALRAEATVDKAIRRQETARCMEALHLICAITLERQAAVPPPKHKSSSTSSAASQREAGMAPRRSTTAAGLAGLTTIDYACVVVDRSPLNSLYCGGEPKDHPADRLCSISREPARSRPTPSAKSSPAFAVRPQVRRGALRADRPRRQRWDLEGRAAGARCFPSLACPGGRWHGDTRQPA